MASHANPLNKMPSADCLRDRLTKAISQVRQLGILLRIAEALEKVAVTPECLEGINVDDLLPPEKESHDD